MQTLTWISDRLDCSITEAGELLAEVEGHPLALRHATTYIRRHGFLVSDYLGDARRNVLAPDVQLSDYPGGLARAMERTISSVRTDPALFAITQVVALLEPPWVPTPILEIICESFDRRDAPILLRDAQILDARADRRSSGLHQLVQRFILSQTTAELAAQLLEHIATVLHQAAHASAVPDWAWLEFWRQILSMPESPGLHCLYGHVLTASADHDMPLMVEGLGLRQLKAIDAALDAASPEDAATWAYERDRLGLRIYQSMTALARGNAARDFLIRQIERASQLGDIHGRAHLLLALAQDTRIEATSLDLLLDAEPGFDLGRDWCQAVSIFYGTLASAIAMAAEANRRAVLWRGREFAPQAVCLDLAAVAGKFISEEQKFTSPGGRLCSGSRHCSRGVGSSPGGQYRNGGYGPRSRYGGGAP